MVICFETAEAGNKGRGTAPSKQNKQKYGDCLSAVLYNTKLRQPPCVYFLFNACFWVHE